MTEDLLLKRLMALVVGGLIGAEREFHTGLGLRTLMLICLGSTLFTIFSDIFAFGEGDPRRIAAAVVNYAWRAYGKPDDHQAAMLALIAEEDVQEFRAL